MTAINFNIRGIPSDIMRELKHEAKKQHMSVNTIILNIIQKGIGYSTQAKKHTYHELDKLSGTWSTEDLATFSQDTKFFEKIDKDIWK